MVTANESSHKKYRSTIDLLQIPLKVEAKVVKNNSA